MNLAAIIDAHPAERVALLSRGTPVTYGALRDQVAGFAASLLGAGVAPGDRVGILAANTPKFVVSYLGTLHAGAVAVPLNPSSPPAELAPQLAAVTPAAMVVGPAGRASWSAIGRDGAPSVRLVVAGDDQVAGATRFDEFVGRAGASPVERGPGDVAALLFTSGTAGSPKAAMLTHGNLRANLDQLQRHPGRMIRADDVLFGVLPMFHIFGLNVVLGLGLAAGACIVLVERFDPSSALDTVRDRGVTVIAGAPPMWTAWATLPDADPSAFASVRLALTGASRMPEAIARLFEQRYHLKVLEGYGLTEAAPVVTSSVGAEPRYGSVGPPLDGVEVRVVDADGGDALVGDAGEVWVRGPNVFAGYWQDPVATARALTPDGWLRTGDIAVVDDDGYLWIVDRAKDLIIVSGFNVYPAEVEEALATHPAVAEVGVVGVPHPHTGEAVKAFVVPRAGVAVEEDELIAHCRELLSRYKCPTKVLFVDRLRRGLGGKVLRRSLDDALGR